MGREREVGDARARSPGRSGSSSGSTSGGGGGGGLTMGRQISPAIRPNVPLSGDK
jgi:hypothetical protein